MLWICRVTKFLALTLCVFTTQVYGAGPAFKTVLDDTAPGDIKVILQDRKGYLWFGARNALLRYDAYNFKSVIYLEESENGIKEKPPYYVTGLFEDKEGDLWISSHSGLFLYDQNREILTRPKDESKALSGPFEHIAQLPSGRLIAGGEGRGLVIFDKESLQITQLLHDPKSPKSLVHNTVNEILVDRQQRTWIATNAGLQLLNEDSLTLDLFIPDPDHPKSEAHNALGNLIEHPSDILLAGTPSAGLYVFDLETHTFTQYRHDPTDPYSLPSNQLDDITVDSKGEVWLTAQFHHLAWFDLESKRIITFPYSSGSPGSPFGSASQAIFTDRNGDIWLGHYPNGISFHDRSTSAIKFYQANGDNPDRSIANNNVLAPLNDDKDNLWLAVGSGVDYFDRQTGRFRHYSQPGGTYGAPGTLSGYIDRHGQVWVGTWRGGYHRYSPEKDRFEALPVDLELASSPETESSVLNDSTIWTFCETRDGVFWIGTHSAGINRYNAKTGTFTRFKNEEQDPTSLGNNIAWSCLEDSKGRFWIGTAWGLSMMNRELGTFKNYVAQEGVANALQSGSVLDVFEDRNGQIWLGTNNGLHLYQEPSDDFKIYSTDDGFIDPTIRGITSDPEGNLWLGTNNGVILFNPSTKAVRNYTELSGIKFGGVNTGAASSNSSGEVIFGSTNGLIIIDTQKLSTNTVPPPVVFTDFKIFTKSATIGGDEDVLSKVIDETTSLTLDHTKGMISFEFSALNFRDSHRNQYAYKLEGFDKEWREVGDLRKAQYTNLSAGKYVFKVRASNNDGVWSQTPKSVQVIQLPPPWLSWWAYCLYATGIFLMLANFVRSQKRKRELVEEQNRLLEIKVAERTADLAAKNKDIQAMLSNMRQGLFTIDVNSIIHHEYSKNLESIFQTDNIAGRKCLDLLFENSNIGTDVHNQIETSFASIIGLHEMNFDFNYHLLLKEYSTRINDKEKILSLEWSPITEDHNVVKLMVSVRDITELKELQLEAAEKRQELALVGELIGVDGESFIEFNRSTQSYLQQNRELIESNTAYNEDAAKKLFRNMHTVKGNSRTHGFSFISNAAHDAESVYSQLKDEHELWQQENLLADLSLVERSLKEYNSVYEEVLGKPLSGGSQSVMVDIQDINNIQRGAGDIQSDHPAFYTQIMNMLNKTLANSMSDTLARLTHSLPSIANELGKTAPDVHIEDNNIRVRKEAQSLLQDVFAHVLRNSIDHGIEAPEQRKLLGKNSAGAIAITLKQQGEHVSILVTDDGGGLNIERLFLKGLERGKWTVENPPKISSIAALVFESEMSTKDQVSDISGRGVGMDAVKAFLTESGGGIELRTEFDNDIYHPGKSASFISFETRISLPQSKFLIA